MTSVLYVEDNQLSRDIMQTILNAVLHLEQYEIFEDSTDIEQRFMDLPFVPEIVFLDIYMEPYDGFETLKRLRALPGVQNTRFIAVTASLELNGAEELRDFDGFISKPLKVREFPTFFERIRSGESVWHQA